MFEQNLNEAFDKYLLPQNWKSRQTNKKSTEKTTFKDINLSLNFILHIRIFIYCTFNLHKVTKHNFCYPTYACKSGYIYYKIHYYLASLIMKRKQLSLENGSILYVMPDMG